MQKKNDSLCFHYYVYDSSLVVLVVIIQCLIYLPSILLNVWFTIEKFKLCCL